MDGVGRGGEGTGGRRRGEGGGRGVGSQANSAYLPGECGVELAIGGRMAGLAALQH